MYPKNAASPQRVAIGPVVQISDGAVQTTGVSVKVMPQGGAASAGGGTIAYEEGIVHYVPTQAETNYASFMLIAYKTGCIPASVTVVTTVSSTAGHAGLDWANVIGPTTTVGLTNTTVGTITTYTGNTPQTGDSFARIGATGSGLTSLASQSSVNTIDDFLDTEIAALTTELAKVPKSDGTATWNATALASIQQEATDALNAYDPPTNAEMEARTLLAANYATASALDTVDNFLDTEIADIQARLPAALVGGRIDANVGAISADSVAADNCEAFFDGTGYAGTNNVIPTVTTLTGHTAQTGDAFARLGAPVGASISADLQTVDTIVDAIKAKTDSLTFTQAGHVDANVQRINDVIITGDGSAGDKFDVV